MACRKNLTRLTLAERQAYVNAVLQLRANGGYDTYVTQHQGAISHGHFGPAFLPWHREYLRRFERDLQAIDSSVNLPYWDWTVGNLNGAGTASLIWTADFMGGPGAANNNFAVADGPFAGWNLRRNAFDIFQFPGGGGTIANLLTNPNYTAFRAGIEPAPHGGAHMWVGGTVADIGFSPRDPVFWLIHTNVDRLWAEWTRNHQGQPAWVQYAPTAGGPIGHNLTDTMWPWNGTTNPRGILPWTVVPESRRPADQLDHRALGYFYDTVDPECRPKPLKERLPKELGKERLPKELKDRIKELKEHGPKELKERLPKELKERGPKELKDLREGPKPFREDLPRPFIGEELRPDLAEAALSFEPDVAALQEELGLRADEFGDDAR
jgi:tyrosinase